MLRIALPNKGRLADHARELFADAGLEVRARSDRALTASLGGEFRALFVRAQDVPEFVADGVADAGVTGLDLVGETGRALDPLVDLEFGHCRLVVAAREESGVVTLDDLLTSSGDGPPRVATSFPRLARRFFETSGRTVEIVPIAGAAEVAPHLGIADVIVDLTSTGSTLKVNGLREVATILESSAWLVAPPGPRKWPPSHAAALDDLVTALTSVLRARGQRYLMANVPRDALSRVREITPGLGGPTVMDVLDGGRIVAVHAVVPAASVYRTIASLKLLGASGILVTRIERLMP
jgi:ATP phosphoribosyltransferase